VILELFGTPVAHAGRVPERGELPADDQLRARALVVHGLRRAGGALRAGAGGGRGAVPNLWLDRVRAGGQSGEGVTFERGGT
jgi:hypothetical protein